MEILIIIGKGILWFIGAIIVSVFVGIVLDEIIKKDGGIDHGMRMIAMSLVTFVVCTIGTVVYFIVF